MAFPEDFRQHLRQIPPEEWQLLFDLIPYLEQKGPFGTVGGGEELPDGAITTYYMAPDDRVMGFFRLAHRLGIVPVFNWTHWKEGQQMLHEPDTDFSALDTETLCKLLTVIIRTDRFSEGYLVACFENGIILKILEGLRNNESP